MSTLLDRSSVFVSSDPGCPVNETIAPDDGMVVADAPPDEARQHYFSVGRSALRCVRLGLAAAGTTEVTRILDLPCGHGRVLRVLKSAFPGATFDVADLNESGVRFCVEQFGAHALPAHPDPQKMQLNGPYDLIWVGSLFTHLDGQVWQGFLQRFREALSPSGVCVMTTHGRWAADLIRTGKTGYGLPDPGKLLKPFDRNGFAYQAYPGVGAYGVSLSKPGWVFEQIAAAGGRLLLYRERAWADHQDCVAWRGEW